MYAGVPITALAAVSVSSETDFASPKSRTFAPFLVSMTLPGFRKKTSSAFP
jgi:hypothetical protein